VAASAKSVSPMSPYTELEIGKIRNASLDSVPSDLPLNAVHLWQRPLQITGGDLEACHALLSPEECERAERYRVERPRSDYILTRGTLRSLLSRYLQRSPLEITFRYTEYGKPYLVEGGNLQFNVSHSEGIAVMGFVRAREIGVDVEKIRKQSDVEQIAERFFSECERRSLRKCQGDQLHEAFFRCWTRKEAYIKAKGEGLSLPLHQFDVSIERQPEQGLLATRPDSTEAKRWRVINMPVQSGYAAALAVGEPIEVQP
jgi:4'-phosphopantetheinyl transferase